MFPSARPAIPARIFSGCLIPVFGLFFLLPLAAGDKPVTMEMAFRSGEPGLTRETGFHDGWLDDSRYLWIEEIEVEDGTKTKAYFTVDAQSGEREPYDKAKTEAEDHRSSLQRTEDREAEVWLDKGDLYYRHVAEKAEKRLTATVSEERNPRFSPDGRWVAYTRDRNLFAMEIASGLERQLTGDGSDTVYNGYASWVYYEEILGRRSRYCAFWWSPDSGRLLFMRFDDSPVRTFSIYHEKGNYGELEHTRYPKAGEDNPLVKMGVVEVASGKTLWLDFDERQDAYLAWPFWAPDGKRIHVQWLNREQDHLVIYECDAENGTKRPIYEERQPAWVEFFEDITYLKDGSGFLLRSDKDGWRHLYLYGMDGALRRRLTSGAWSVNEILAVDEAKGTVYFQGSKEDSTGQDLFRVGLDGKGLKQLTRGGGTHRITLSPGFSFFIDETSDYRTPSQINLHHLDGTLIRNLADRRNPEAEEYRLGKVEFFTIPTEDGYALPAWWVLPPDFDPENGEKYAVIFRIYSGPGAPMVRNGFFWRWREHFYADQGVITMSVDHRGSGHFGKEGVALMHRKLGHWEVKDLSAAVRWLREKPFIDASRIGITGHSYGGYMTLLALAKAPDLFTHGVAGAPVTDWSLYDTVYTERYMDRPQDNPEGYREGSVLTYADKIEGRLRLIHGTVDDNVHLQNTLQVVDILTRKGIQFELMLYPGSRHGISQRRHQADGEHAFWFRHFLNQPFSPKEPETDQAQAGSYHH